MKKTVIALAALISIATTAPAVAEGTADVLQEQIVRLTERVELLGDKVEQKNDLLACERNTRRTLERALRTGEPVGHVARCR